MSQPAADIEVLEPLRGEEQELDALLSQARAEADRTVVAARAKAQAWKEEADASLKAEIASLGGARARRNEAQQQARTAETARQLTALGESVRARRQAALDLIVARVIGEPP